MAEKSSVWRVMQLLLGLVTVFVVLGFTGRLFTNQDSHVQPGSPEYAAYIRDEIARCANDELAEDLKKSRAELPVLPTQAERVAGCRGIVLQMDGLYPETRPMKEPAN